MGTSSKISKKAIIQNHNYDDSSPVGERPCRAEIRWYGATDGGLRDIRDNVKLWGLKSEIALHAKLSAMEEHKDKSAIEISEMVLAEKLDVKLKERLYKLKY